MIFIKKFNSKSECDDFLESTLDFPNVSLSEEQISYNASVPFWLEGNSTINYITDDTFEYRIGDSEWVVGNSDTDIKTNGNKVFFRAVATPIIGSAPTRYFKKSNTAHSIKVGGNIMSLLFGKDYQNKFDLTGYDYAFSGLLSQLEVTDFNDILLPAIKLSKGCYNSLFSRSKATTCKVKLPATILAPDCYNSMFRYCYNLEEAPELPATTLADSCYRCMFFKCYKLTKISTTLPATTLQLGCYREMFYDCTSLTNIPIINFTKSAPVACYEMFRGCTSLTEIPIMDISAHSSGGCRGMFAKCTSLINAGNMIIRLYGESGSQACYGMFEDCTSLVYVPKLPSTTLTDTCYEGMFDNCTSLVNAPELPATTLEFCCYQGMFRDCTSLNYIKMLATDISATNCLSHWVSGVPSIGTFIKNASMESLPTGESGIPEGWTVETAAS